METIAPFYVWSTIRMETVAVIALMPFLADAILAYQNLEPESRRKNLQALNLARLKMRYDGRYARYHLQALLSSLVTHHFFHTWMGRSHHSQKTAVSWFASSWFAHATSGLLEELSPSFARGFELAVYLVYQMMSMWILHLIYNMYYYFVHRLLHHSLLYPHIHKFHHDTPAKEVCLWDAYISTLSEIALHSVVLTALCHFLGMHEYTSCVTLAFGAAFSLYDHHKKNVDHMDHHKNPRVAFGTGDPLWDSLFCTDAKSDRIRSLWMDRLALCLGVFWFLPSVFLLFGSTSSFVFYLALGQ